MSRYDYGFSDVIGSERVIGVDGVIQRSNIEFSVSLCVCPEYLTLYVPMLSVWSCRPRNGRTAQLGQMTRHTHASLTNHRRHRP
jgi:hypothetical protein